MDASEHDHEGYGITDAELDRLLAQGRAELEAEESDEESDWGEDAQIVTIIRHGPGLVEIDSDENDDTVSAILARAFIQFNEAYDVAAFDGDEEEGLS